MAKGFCEKVDIGEYEGKPTYTATIDLGDGPKKIGFFRDARIQQYVGKETPDFELTSKGDGKYLNGKFPSDRPAYAGGSGFKGGSSYKQDPQLNMITMGMAYSVQSVTPMITMKMLTDPAIVQQWILDNYKQILKAMQEAYKNSQKEGETK